MPIPVQCPGCGQKMKANDALAGRRLPCPKCKHELEIPKPQIEEDAAALLLGGEPEAEAESAEPEKPRPATASTPAPVYSRGPVKPKPVETLASLPPLKSGEPPLWLRHLHWLLMLALVPLAVSLLHKGSDDRDIVSRLEESIDNAPPETQAKIERMAQREDVDLDDIIVSLPRHRLIGAALARDTLWHWVFALAATVLFLSFCVFLATGGVADPKHLLAVGLFTGTIGILFLFIVQAIAEATQGVTPIRGGIVMIFIWIAKLIGLSYRAALDPDNGFWVSFLGFTAGVGLCEEVVKAMPIIVRYCRSPDDSWRKAFLWGLASGAGFGIAEGVIYSGSYYNGITGSGIYVVRFISCVALHAQWTGSVAIAAQQKQHLLQRGEHWRDLIAPVLVYVAVPMVLHGLYDTLLKKDMPGVALLVALASFGYLAFQISRLHSVDDKEATAEMLREYKRRRKMVV